jgi:hypothetical protein
MPEANQGRFVAASQPQCKPAAVAPPARAGPVFMPAPLRAGKCAWSKRQRRTVKNFLDCKAAHSMASGIRLHLPRI